MRSTSAILFLLGLYACAIDAKSDGDGGDDKEEGHPWKLLREAVAKAALEVENEPDLAASGGCPFKRANQKMREAERDQKILHRTLQNLQRSSDQPDMEEIKISEEEDLIADLQDIVGESSHMEGNIAGGQDAFAEKPLLMHWGCKKDFPKRSICDEHEHYKTTRTISGVCNNLQKPIWGASSTEQLRMVNKPAYADGAGEPRGGWKSSRSHCCSGEATAKPRETCETVPDALLPNPRLVRQHFHTTESALDPKTTTFFTVFGQYLDHDLSLTPEAPTLGCCNYMKETNCFAMKEIYLDSCKDSAVCDSEDMAENPVKVFLQNVLPTKAEGSKECYKLARSLNFCQSGTVGHDKYRQQFNAITSFIDASTVYGSDINLHRRLRVPNSPYMDDTDSVNPVVPEVNGTHALAGDKRASEVPELLAIHTLFLREHNRIVMDILEHLNANGDARADDVYFVFEKAREIVIAETQNIVYDQYLVALLGPDTVEFKEKNKFMDLRERGEYLSHVNPGIFNEFSTAAYRFGHSMIPAINKKYSLTMNATVLSEYSIRHNFFNTTQYSMDDSLGLEQILNGLSKEQSEGCDPFLDSNLAEHLFENNNNFADDLGARNIQRGRDHGLPGYNDYRELCGMERACSWDESDRPNEISYSKWKTLSELYDHPSDIDLFTAGLAENEHYNGGTVGRTFNCILKRQFMNVKCGDRFFFNHKQTEADTEMGLKRFTDAQVDHIRERHLHHLLCDNTDVKEMRENVFMLDSPFVPCTEDSTLDISLFIDDAEEPIPV